MTVGSRNAAIVQRRLPVSFFMVRQVVEQGQWNRENTAMHSAVLTVQPWAANSVRRVELSDISTRQPV